MKDMKDPKGITFWIRGMSIFQKIVTLVSIQNTYGTTLSSIVIMDYFGYLMGTVGLSYLERILLNLIRE